MREYNQRITYISHLCANNKYVGGGFWAAGCKSTTLEDKNRDDYIDLFLNAKKVLSVSPCVLFYN